MDRGRGPDRGLRGIRRGHPGRISGAVLLLPFQVSILGTPSPAVTPTNLLYNVLSTPGALYRYRRQHQSGGRLARS